MKRNDSDEDPRLPDPVPWRKSIAHIKGSADDLIGFRTFGKLKKVLLSVLARLGVRVHDAEDIVQDTMAKVVRRQRAEGGQNFSIPLILTMLHGEWVDWLRERDRRREEALESVSEGQFGSVHSGYADLEIREMVQKYKSLIRAEDWELLTRTPAEAAGALGVSVDTVYGRREHALKRVRRVLARAGCRRWGEHV